MADAKLFGLIFLLIAVFSTFAFGVSGFKTIMGIIFAFFLPAYLILKKSAFSENEKLFFSIFLGAVLFPALIYWPAVIMPLKAAVPLVFLLVSGAGLIFLLKSKK